MTRQEIKTWAKEKIKGNLWNILGAILIVNLVSSITTSIKTENSAVVLILSLGGGVLAFILEVGLVDYLLKFINNKKYEFGIIFSKFKHWKNLLLTYLLEFLYIFLWTLVFIVPGIIKAYSYRLIPFIMNDDLEMDSKEALKLSEEIMNGHKWDLFVLELSFVGWQLLGILTLGILYIWLIPYMQVTITKFLYDIKSNYEKN